MKKVTRKCIFLISCRKYDGNIEEKEVQEGKLLCGRRFFLVLKMVV